MLSSDAGCCKARNSGPLVDRVLWESRGADRLAGVYVVCCLSHFQDVLFV